jgi:hypothetical protein
MIDWIGVATNSLWLLGLAVCLAVLSYADWNAHSASRRPRDVLGQPAFHLALWSGLTLFCIGVALSGGRWWERILWGVLTVMAVVEVWQAGRIVLRPERGGVEPR